MEPEPKCKIHHCAMDEDTRCRWCHQDALLKKRSDAAVKATATLAEGVKALMDEMGELGPQKLRDALEEMRGLALQAQRHAGVWSAMVKSTIRAERGEITR